MDGRSKNPLLLTSEQAKQLSQIAKKNEEYLAQVEKAFSMKNVKKKFVEQKFTLPDGKEFTITHDDIHGMGQKISADLRRELSLTDLFDIKLFYIWDKSKELITAIKTLETNLNNISEEQNLISGLIAAINNGIADADDLTAGVGVRSAAARKEISKLLEEKSKELDKERKKQKEKKLDTLPLISPLIPVLGAQNAAIKDLDSVFETQVANEESIPRETRLKLMLYVPDCAVVFEAECMALQKAKDRITELKATQTSIDTQIPQVTAAARVAVEALKKLDTTKQAKPPGRALAPQAISVVLAAKQPMVQPIAGQVSVPKDNFVKFVKAATWVQNKLALMRQVLDAKYQGIVAAIDAQDVVKLQQASSAFRANAARFLALVQLQKECKLDAIPAERSPVLMTENFNAYITKFLTEFTSLMKDTPALVEELRATFKEIVSQKENRDEIGRGHPKLTLFTQNQKKLQDEILPNIVTQVKALRDAMIKLFPALTDTIATKINPLLESAKTLATPQPSQTKGTLYGAAAKSAPATPLLSSKTSFRPGQYTSAQQ